MVSWSSAEFEYKGLANATSKLIWIEAFLNELHIPFSTPPVLLCDNLCTTRLAAPPILRARTKHIEIDYHFIRDRMIHNSLLVKFTPSKEQLANILTKPLPTCRFQSLRTKLIVLHSPFSLRGMLRNVISYRIRLRDVISCRKYSIHFLFDTYCLLSFLPFNIYKSPPPGSCFLGWNFVPLLCSVLSSSSSCLLFYQVLMNLALRCS